MRNRRIGFRFTGLNAERFALNCHDLCQGLCQRFYGAGAYLAWRGVASRPRSPCRAFRYAPARQGSWPQSSRVTWRGGRRSPPTHVSKPIEQLQRDPESDRPCPESRSDLSCRAERPFLFQIGAGKDEGRRRDGVQKLGNLANEFAQNPPARTYHRRPIMQIHSDRLFGHFAIDQLTDFDAGGCTGSQCRQLRQAHHVGSLPHSCERRCLGPNVSLRDGLDPV